MEKGRRKVINFKPSKLDPNLVNEKLDQANKKFDYAAKVTLGFVLRNIENGQYR